MQQEPGGLYADRQTARDAIQFARPLLESALSNPRVGLSGVLHIVVMDPTRPPGRYAFEDAILVERSFGKDRSAWDADYAAFARAKARVSWQTQRDSAVVQAHSPHLLVQGDTTLWGSVALEGIVVAISGLEPMYDEALSGVIAMCLRGVAKARAAGHESPAAASVPASAQ